MCKGKAYENLKLSKILLGKKKLSKMMCKVDWLIYLILYIKIEEQINKENDDVASDIAQKERNIYCCCILVEPY